MKFGENSNNPELLGHSQITSPAHKENQKSWICRKPHLQKIPNFFLEKLNIVSHRSENFSVITFLRVFWLQGHRVLIPQILLSHWLERRSRWRVVGGGGKVPTNWDSMFSLLQLARKRGFEVFFITARLTSQREATKRNLEAEGYEVP